MKRVNLFIGGFFATVIMTLALYLSQVTGAPRLDIAALLGSLLGHGVPAPMTGIWWAGMAWHLINGTFIFPLIYAFFAYRRLMGDNWLRGDIWGVILWAAMGFVFLPVIGRGVFGSHMGSPAGYAVVSFVCHAIYGTIFGALAGVQDERSRGIPHPA